MKKHNITDIPPNPFKKGGPYTAASYKKDGERNVESEILSPDGGGPQIPGNWVAMDGGGMYFQPDLPFDGPGNSAKS